VKKRYTVVLYIYYLSMPRKEDNLGPKIYQWR